MNRPVLVLAGATASGKSAAALDLALRLNGEIVSIDSMQIYRGMDIGTAKPGPADRDRVPHHLVDMLTLREECDAATFAVMARKAVAEIRSRGKLPVLCGGTGFYLKAILEGVSSNPASDRELRLELERRTLPELLDELAQGDPSAYERIDRQNPRRVIRAVEILRLRASAPPASAAKAPEPDPLPWAGLALCRTAEDLRARIDARVDAMFRAGLVEETRRLLGEGLAENRTAGQALGYRQVIEHLRGERDLAETIEEVKRRTRLYAKRQGTWFRRQPGLAWLNVAASEPPAEITARIEAFFVTAGVLG